MTSAPEIGRAPGWYLLAGCDAGAGSSFPRLEGVDSRGEFQIPLRTNSDGSLRRVVLLRRRSSHLRVFTMDGEEAHAWSLRLISTGKALRIMCKEILHPEGGRDLSLVVHLVLGALRAAAKLDPRALGEAIVTAYMSTAWAGSPCVIRTRLLPRSAFLEPLDGLSRVPGDPSSCPAWEAVDGDPKMLLVDRAGDKGLPAGWYRFRLEVECISGSLVAPALCPEYLDNTQVSETIELPEPDAGGRVDILVLFKYPVRHLHFKPTRRRTKFRLTRVHLQRISTLRALCQMLQSNTKEARSSRRGAFQAMPILLGALRAAAKLEPRAIADAIAATYTSTARPRLPCIVRTGWLAHTAFLDPLDGLTHVPDEPPSVPAWEAADDDPKMLLVDHAGHITLPAGWYLFRLEAECISGRVVAPALYPDYHDERVPTETIELPDPDPEGRIDALVLFKFPVRRLRFDPTRRQARFRLRGVRLQRISRARALVRMLQPVTEEGRWSLQGAFGSARAFLSDCTRSGVSMAAVMVHERYRRALVQRAGDYRQWTRKYDNPGAADLSRLVERAGRLGTKTKFSVLVPVYDTPAKYLSQCIESVLAQAWPHWELCLVDDASPSPHVKRILTEHMRKDARIRVEFRQRNGHICEASNDALRMATGDYVALLDHDDLLRPNALLEMAEAIATEPDLDLLYSDEDKIDGIGERFDPYFKPDWNPDLLLGQNYICHLTVLRTTLARMVGGFRPGFEGSQDHDLVLRCSRAIDEGRIRHVPRVLYHWRAIPGSTALHRDAKDYAAEAGAKAVQEHVLAENPNALVEHLDQGHYRVRWPLPTPAPRVSIIVPTRDRAHLLKNCVRSLLEKTDYPDFELLLVDNGTVEPEALVALRDLDRDPRVRLVRDESPFNYSALNNRAAAIASGELLALVNNDIEVITPDWLGEMVSLALRPGVGAVGAMLLYPDNTIQHAGVILGLGGIANHAYLGEPAGIGGHGGRARVTQSMSAVTGACLVVRRDLFLEIGGLEEQLQVAFNDIDFCLRLREAGYRNLWTPFARLYHHESASRGLDTEGEKRDRFLGEVGFMHRRWDGKLETDPAYNPNFSLLGPGFELADPPRT